MYTIYQLMNFKIQLVIGNAVVFLSVGKALCRSKKNA